MKVTSPAKNHHGCRVSAHSLAKTAPMKSSRARAIIAEMLVRRNCTTGGRPCGRKILSTASTSTHVSLSGCRFAQLSCPGRHLRRPFGGSTSRHGVYQRVDGGQPPAPREEAPLKVQLDLKPRRWTATAGLNRGD